MKMSEKPVEKSISHGTHVIQIEMVNKQKRHTGNKIGYENSENIVCNMQRTKKYLRNTSLVTKGVLLTKRRGRRFETETLFQSL